MSHIKISELTVNPAYRNALPDLSEQEVQRLLKSIDSEGQQIPIIVDYENNIIDGHNRVMIFEELGIEYIEADFKDFGTEEETIKKIQDLQLARRNMSKEKIEETILKVATEIKAELGERRGGDSSKAGAIATTGAFGQKTSEIIAEKVSEELNIPVSARKVERTLSKDKPKTFKEKETTRVVIVYFRKSPTEWEVYKKMFDSKKEASDHIKEQLEAHLPYYNREYALSYSDVDFLTKQDQMAWKGWLND